MYNEKNIDFVAGKIVGMIKEYRVDTMYMYLKQGGFIYDLFKLKSRFF